MNCMICGFSGSSFYSFTIRQNQRGEMQWFRCPSCKGFFRVPPASAEYETRHVRENSLHGQLQTGLEMNRYKERLFKKILEVISSAKKPPLEIFDHGASYGGFCFLAKALGHTVYGMDIFPDAVEYLVKNGIGAEAAASISGLKKYRDKKFDVVTSIDSCYYWSGLSTEISYIKGFLKENGMLLLRTSEKSWMLRAGLLLKGMPSLSNLLLRKSVHDHLTCTPLPALLSILKKNDMKVIRISSLNAIPSYHTPLSTKILYWAGEAMYRLFRISFSPGFVVVCVKDKMTEAKQKMA